LIFEKLAVAGAFLIRPEPMPDDRGFFARTFGIREFSEQGLDAQVVQRSMSYNRRTGTLRGMHFQVSPHEENKQVWCSRGAIYDVIIDLRPASPTYRRWISATLSSDDRTILYVPAMCAHGFLTLQDDTIVQYDISGFHHPEAARGIRYDDPAFAIEWPSAPLVINARDQSYPPFGY
jgi:dTDP-4-dehydrorhamnose 3,5-epimerase